MYKCYNIPFNGHVRSCSDRGLSGNPIPFPVSIPVILKYLAYITNRRNTYTNWPKIFVPRQLKGTRGYPTASDEKQVFAQETYDMLWCTGLESEAKLHTDSRKWPGENRLEKNFGILQSIGKGKSVKINLILMYFSKILKRVVRKMAKVTPYKKLKTLSNHPL